MKKLPLFALVLAATLATAADLPEEVLVQTDMVPAAKFTPWKATEPSKFAGTYEGDVGGDTSGKLQIKITKSGKEEVTYNASGSYHHATAGQEPSVVTFTRGLFNEADEKFATMTAGPVTITFVTLDGAKGVIIGGAFIPKS